MAGKTGPRVLRVLSLAALLIGSVLAGLMAWTEGEPGALPLAVMFMGAVGAAYAWGKRPKT